MSINNYIKRKEKGSVLIKKIKDSFAFVIKRFDTETGEELQPEEEAVDLKTLENYKLQLQGQIADINQAIADIIALEETKILK